MLLFWAVLFSAVIINCFTSQALARLERAILILHLVGFVAVLVPLVCLGPHGNGSVFTTFVNEGAWPTQSLSFFVGLPAAVFSLVVGNFPSILDRFLNVVRRFSIPLNHANPIFT